ncbi:MAG TPA: laccase domain-containing protein, partial [Deltaproteobacteria bacterium]|nr:laccase domain-containing protein [Deltaproteobacteria bacterium]
GIRHGFGRKGSQVPGNTVFPVQVHGTRTVRVGPGGRSGWTSADALTTRVPGVPIGIVTADCVPILVAAGDGGGVAAIHAGWRGLAAGVIESAIGVLAETSGVANLHAAVGPAARGCCYEVDEPVRRALEARYEALLPGTLVPGRADRFQLDLPALATEILIGLGFSSDRIGLAHRICTICHPALFESHRRDGARAGRLRHFICCADGESLEG